MSLFCVCYDSNESCCSNFFPVFSVWPHADRTHLIPGERETAMARVQWRSSCSTESWSCCCWKGLKVKRLLDIACFAWKNVFLIKHCFFCFWWKLSSIILRCRHTLDSKYSSSLARTFHFISSEVNLGWKYYSRTRLGCLSGSLEFETDY